VEKQYSISDILEAVNELNKKKIENIYNEVQKHAKIESSLIPKDTQKIIEEAEKILYKN
jgi:hypothetical protein